jgi:23S rRNA (uracil1939-C5)-methyltransferase
VHAGPALDPWGFRTTLRLAVTDGRLGLRRSASNEVVTLAHCLVAHPRLDEMIVDGRFPEASYVTLRVGAATGERLALVAPPRAGVLLPDDVLVVGADELAAGTDAWIHDDVAGRHWRISAASFFQTRADGAAVLVDVVRAMAADVLERERGVLFDAYSGVGLFAGALLHERPRWRAVTVESDSSSVADARVNLADLDVRIVETSVERVKPPRADLVVADPSRAGLGVDAAAAITATRAERIVLVSCDPAAAGRDVGLLKSRGYRPIESVVVDLFPHTHHPEVVTRLERVGDGVGERVGNPRG